MEMKLLYYILESTVDSYEKKKKKNYIYIYIYIWHKVVKMTL